MTWGDMVYRALDAAARLGQDAVEVVDLRTIAPWDRETVLGSVEKTGRCSHCGAHLRYAAILEHVSGTRIMVGEDCLGNRGNRAQEDFEALREAAAEQAKLTRRVGKLELFLQAAPDFRELLATPQRNAFVADVLAKLEKNGELSTNQVHAVRDAVARDNEFARRRAQEAAEMVAAPEGRVTFTGTVVGVKIEEAYYGDGGVRKLIVRADGNFKAYITAPSSIDFLEEYKGLRLQVTATLSPSRNDATFAIGKRPVVKVLEAEVA